MSSRYHAEKLTREATVFYLSALIQGAKLAFEPVAKKFNLTPRQTTNLLHYLKRRQFIKGSAKDGYVITHNGSEKLLELQLKRLDAPAIWDKRWRLILFDIPETKRTLRNKIRQLLKELSCIQLQKSVWIHSV